MNGLLLIALIGGGAALLAMKPHAASASGPSTAPTVPPDATVETFPPPFIIAGVPLLKRSSWRVTADSSGQQAGTMMLLQNASDPNDWVLGFKNAASGASGILAYAKTPIGGLLAQAAAAGL